MWQSRNAAPRVEVPRPVQLGSLKSENEGQDPGIRLVPAGGGGWGRPKEDVEEPESQPTNPRVGLTSQPAQLRPTAWGRTSISAQAGPRPAPWAQPAPGTAWQEPVEKKQEEFPSLGSEPKGRRNSGSGSLSLGLGASSSCNIARPIGAPVPAPEKRPVLPPPPAPSPPPAAERRAKDEDSDKAVEKRSPAPSQPAPAKASAERPRTTSEDSDKMCQPLLRPSFCRRLALSNRPSHVRTMLGNSSESPCRCPASGADTGVFIWSLFHAHGLAGLARTPTVNEGAEVRNSARNLQPERFLSSPFVVRPPLPVGTLLQRREVTTKIRGRFKVNKHRYLKNVKRVRYISAIPQYTGRRQPLASSRFDDISCRPSWKADEEAGNHKGLQKDDRCPVIRGGSLETAMLQSLIDAEPVVSEKEFMKTLADKRRAEKKDEEEAGCDLAS
ncbi:unnamed protein product [Symbiodinium sp. CCMP2592]|nr:unnamed protein product [Symbiodinium sp. CCMP2592]